MARARGKWGNFSRPRTQSRKTGNARICPDKRGAGGNLGNPRNRRPIQHTSRREAPVGRRRWQAERGNKTKETSTQARKSYKMACDHPRIQGKHAPDSATRASTPPAFGLRLPARERKAHAITRRCEMTTADMVRTNGPCPIINDMFNSFVERAVFWKQSILVPAVSQPREQLEEECGNITWLNPTMEAIMGLPWEEKNLPDDRRPPEPRAAAQLLWAMVDILGSKHDSADQHRPDIHRRGDGGMACERLRPRHRVRPERQRSVLLPRPKRERVRGTWGRFNAGDQKLRPQPALKKGLGPVDLQAGTPMKDKQHDGIRVQRLSSQPT